MSFPTQVVFKNLSHSTMVEQLVMQRAAKLERYYKDIITCRVVVELPHRHHQSGNAFSVRIDISVPGKEIAITRDDSSQGSKGNKHKDLHAALKDAFAAAERELENYKQLRRRA